jgi:hypothetical protein
MIASLGSSILKVDGSALEIRCDTPEDLNRSLDLLRAAGGTIESMAPKKTTLEDVFVDLIKTSDITH